MTDWADAPGSTLGARDAPISFRAGSPSDTRWSVLYDVDLRELPSTTLRGPGGASYRNLTLGDAPWYYHGSASTAELVHGTGIVCSASGNLGYDGCRFGVRVYALPGYQPAKHVAVQVRYSAAQSTSLYGADAWTGGEAWGYGPGQDTTHVIRNAAAQHVAYRNQGASGYRNLELALKARETPTPMQVAELVFAIAATPPGDSLEARVKDEGIRTLYYQRDVFSSALPPIEEMQPIAAYNNAPATPDLKLGFFVGSPDAGLVTATATHLRILQRPVVGL